MKNCPTHAANATLARIQKILKPSFDVRVKKVTAHGYIDCRVFPAGKFENSDRIGSLMILGSGTIAYAPRVIQDLLRKRRIAC